MKDRIVEFATRYRLDKVAGTDNIYDFTPVPGEVTEEGTPINKATLLTDMSAEMFGLDSSAVVNDVWDIIAPQVVATIVVTGPTTGSTVTATNGTKTKTLKESSGMWTFVGATNGTWTITATLGGDSASDTVTVSEPTTYSLTLLYTQIYGATWDGTSTTKWTRTDQAASFADPVPYVSGASSYGSPFDNLYPWNEMKRVTDSAAGELVAIPKFWYQLTQNGSTMTIRIADKKPSEGAWYVSPAHSDRGDGAGERDIVYIGRYHCAQSSYKSASGSNPMASQTSATFRTNIHNLGSTVWQCDWLMRFTIWLLYIVEFADWNSQATIGYGCSTSSAVMSMGYTDSMPYHTGTTASSRTTYGGTQYRYIEGLWDNVYDFLGGVYYSSAGMSIIKNPSNFSSADSQSGGTSIGTPTNGWPSAFTVNSSTGLPLFIPSATGGNASTYSCDYWNFDSSDPVVYVGGYCSQSTGRGLFCVSYSYVSSAGGSLGSRLQKLP